MKKIHVVQKLEFKENKMYLKADDKEYVFQIEKISTKLLNVSAIEREKYQISPSGYGLHWLLIDEDLSIDGLLGIKHIPSRKQEMAAI